MMRLPRGKHAHLHGIVCPIHFILFTRKVDWQSPYSQKSITHHRFASYSLLYLQFHLIYLWDQTYIYCEIRSTNLCFWWNVFDQIATWLITYLADIVFVIWISEFLGVSINHINSLFELTGVYKTRLQ